MPAPLSQPCAHSCGKALPSCHTKLEKESLDGVGSFCIWGRHVFMGYLNDKESTEKKLDNYGWLHTSDLGFLDFDKFLYVLGDIHGEESARSSREGTLGRSRPQPPVSRMT